MEFVGCTRYHNAAIFCVVAFKRTYGFPGYNFCFLMLFLHVCQHVGFLFGMPNLAKRQPLQSLRWQRRLSRHVGWIDRVIGLLSLSAIPFNGEFKGKPYYHRIMEAAVVSSSSFEQD